MTISVAFIGLGNMGNPMAMNLLKKGYALSVFDTNPAAAANLIAAGAKGAASAAEAIANADVVFGIYGAAGTPKDIVSRLNREIGRGMQSKEIATTLGILAAELVSGSAEEFAEQQRRDRERYGVFVREAGIKAD